VVTGASRGIGEAMAQELAGRGSRVTVIARSQEPLEAVARRVSGAAVVADLGDRDQLDGLLGRIEAEHGPVDLLVNNAAIVAVSPFWQLSAEEVSRVLAVNLTAPLELTRQALPGMLMRRRGSVVNLSSFAAFAVVPTVAPYCAAKAGLAHFTATLQRELKGSAVKAMIAHLGQVEGSEMMADAFESPPIRVAARRMERLGVMPALEIPDLTARLCDAIEARRSRLVLPARMTPMHDLREIPSLLNDLLIAGREARLELP
jgi:short-subunit dehydrogenase